MKKKVGKPPKFKNEKELNDTILAYFNKCETDKQIANKAGLCMFLKISRDTYSEYRKRYPDTVKGADFAIENVWVQRLAGNAPTGAIFYLKNAFKEEYKDHNQTDITSGGKPIKNEIIIKKFDATGS